MNMTVLTMTMGGFKVWKAKSLWEFKYYNFCTILFIAIQNSLIISYRVPHMKIIEFLTPLWMILKKESSKITHTPAYVEGE